MSTTPQSEQPLQSTVQNETVVGEPPAPTTRTIVVTSKPALIPDESANVLCLTRRNMFDAIIAFLLVAGIIYLVFYWRQARPMTGLTRAMNTGIARGIGQGTSNIGRQIAGAFKNIFK